MEIGMYFIGQTRFSLYIPGSNAWNVSNFTEEEYIAHLFSDERMAIRAKIFSEISVPMLAKMKGEFDYKHIVSYSSIMPEKWKKVLFDLQKEYPFIYLHEADSNKVNPIYQVLKNKPNGCVAFFRLDDDDLLSINFLNSLSKYNNLAFRNMAVSFGKGFAGYYKENHFIDFRECKQRFIAIGQAYIGTYIDGKVELPAMHSHHNLDENYPVIVDSREFMYIHTHHAQQDTNYRFSNDPSNKTNTVESDLMKYPKVKSSSIISESFPYLIKDVHDFLNNKKSVCNINSVKLSNKYSTFEIKNNIEEIVFDCEFELRTEESIYSSKAFVLSIFPEDSSSNIQGMTQSNNPDIGWYKYISVSAGLSKGEFSFSLDRPMKIEKLKITIWDNRIKEAEIKSINLFS